MHNKLFLVLVIFLFPKIIKSQIGISFSMELDKKSAIVTVKNNSSKYYAFPIEMTNLKPYYKDDEVCEYFQSYHSPSHGLSLSLKLTDPKTKLILEPQSRFPDIDLESFEKYLKENKGCFSTDKEKEKWQAKYKIKDKNTAELNYYIYNNLILLRPNQRINFRILIDLENISNELYFAYKYDIKPDTKYLFELYTEINDCVYNILTPEQKDKLKDYTLFTGKITSDLIDCNLNTE